VAGWNVFTKYKNKCKKSKNEISKTAPEEDPVLG
jgi:hypothetical protein